MVQQRIFGLALLVALASGLCFSPVVPTQADTADIVIQLAQGELPDQVGIRPSRPDFLGEGPQALAVSPAGEFFILDTLNNRIIRYQPATDRYTLIPLPEGTGAFDLAFQADHLYVLDGVQGVVWQLDLSGGVVNTYPFDTRQVGALSSHLAVTTDGQVHWLLLNRQDIVLPPADETVAAGGTTASVAPVVSAAGGAPVTVINNSRQLYVKPVRSGPNRGNLLVHQADGQPVISLAVAVEQILGSATLIAVDAAGNYYALVEQLLQEAPGFQVETTVWQFSPTGVHLGTARVPLELGELLPHRFVAVDSWGGAYFLGVQAGAATIHRLEFTPGAVSQPVPVQAPVMTRFTFPAEPAEPAELAGPAAELAEPAEPAAESAEPAAGIESISRGQIMQNAEAYLNVNWTLGPANYHTGPRDDWVGCGTAEHWRLPRYLAGQLNQVIAEVPYEYGGKVSPATFLARIQGGYWAGNICQEGGDIPQATGIDCSGFVQNCWQTSTQYLPSVSHVIGWQELRPGDLMFREDHSILFAGFINGADISGGVYTYESTMTNWVDRVVYWTRNYNELSSYTPRRYNDVSEDPLPTIPAYQNVVLNPGFDTNNLTNWWRWGDVDYAFYGSGILCFKRHPGGDGGSIGQDGSYFVPNQAPLELTLQLGNTSAVEKVPGIFIRSGDHWDIACWFSIPPYSPLQTYTVRGLTQADWYGLTIEVWPDPPDGIPDVLMDNVSLMYRPDLTLSGTECLAAADPASHLADTPVPLYRGTPARSGVSAYNAPVKPGLLWSLSGSDRATSPVIGADDVIYLGLDNAFLAVAPNGVVLWRYEAGTRFTSSAAITAGGNLYVGNDNGLLYAFNRAGTLLWTYPLGGWTTSAPAIGSDGTIYVGSSDYKMRALTPQGGLLWEFTAGHWIQSSPALGADGTIYFGSADQTLYALNRSGGLKWSFQAAASIDSAPAIGPDGTVYVGDIQGVIHALDPATGAQKWQLTANGMLAVDSLAVAPDGTVYFAIYDRDAGNGFDEDTRLYALRPTGAVKWYYTFPDNPQAPPVVTANGRILIAADNGRLYLLDPDGQLIWSHRLESYGRWLRGSPAVNSRDQVLVISSWPAKLYAVGEISNQLFIPAALK
jgi:outer membrane protein assembly factor BamB